MALVANLSRIYSLVLPQVVYAHKKDSKIKGATGMAAGAYSLGPERYTRNKMIIKHDNKLERIRHGLDMVARTRP